MMANRNLALGALLAIFALAACVPTTAPTNQGIGTATGAVVGGLIGANVDASDQALATAAGAAIGAVVGGAIGAQLDRQKAELDQGFVSDDIEVINTGSELIVRMPNGILFDVDSATVRPQVQSDLYVLAGNLLRYPNSTIFVTGHTDNTGDAAYNQQLSQRRAQSVSSILIAGGVAPARIIATGRGEDQPIASNLTVEGRQLNRRVDITIRPNQ